MINNMFAMGNYRFSKYYFVQLFFCISLFSCKGLISIDSANDKIDDKSVFSIDETAIAMVTNIYTQLSQECRSFNGAGNIMNISLYAGLSSDELVLFGADNVSYYQHYINSLTADNAIYTWASIYNKIFLINSAINGVSNSGTLSNAVKQQLLGETKFLRAFCYFNLINLYGDVPLILSTDPLVNSTASRAPIDDVYKQVVEDLVDAQSLLSTSFLSGNLVGVTNERVRPTKWAATALLARVYLYTSDYVNAEKQASILIENTSLFNLDSLDGVFMKNSNECIWQIQNVYNTNANTGDGQTYILPSSGPDGSNFPVYLSSFILDDFEQGDLRRTHWVSSITTPTGDKYYFPYKYKSGPSTENGSSTEYAMVLRLGELYLIRAEALVQQGKTSLATVDINMIRKRAGLNEINTNIKDSLLAIILNERKLELFTESGHRWFDLKRTKNINSVMSVVTPSKGGSWESISQLFPIATSELLADPKLVQNPGY